MLDLMLQYWSLGATNFWLRRFMNIFILILQWIFTYVYYVIYLEILAP